MADVKVRSPVHTMTWRGWQDFPTETAWEMSANEAILHMESMT